MNKIEFELKQKSGIYEFFNLVNGKRYIGSSVDLYNRLHEHLHNLKNNKSHNKHFQNAWNKYGEEMFIFGILEYCDEEIRFEREQYYINVLKPEYNFSLQVVANFGHSPSDETKEKISNTLKQKYASGEITTYKQQHLWKTHYIYDILSFKLVAICKNQIEALSLLRGQNSKGNFDLNTVYKEQYIISLEKITNLNELKNFISEKYLTVRKTNKGKYLITETPEGQLIYHRTTTSCATFNGISSSMILKNPNCTKDNPYCPKKTVNKIYYSDIYFPINENTAVQVEESLELQLGNIGESPEMDNTEINLETKESKSSYSVEGETL